jgi:hypothetical protein
MTDNIYTGCDESCRRARNIDFGAQIARFSAQTGLRSCQPRQEPILPQRTPSTTDGTALNSQVTQAIAFAYSFLEKFIQLPFFVPAPNDLDEFLQSVSQHPESKKVGKGAPSGDDAGSDLKIQLAPRPVGPDSPGDNQSADPAAGTGRTEKERQEFVLGLERDSDFIRQTAKWVGQTFDYNPRRLKQFINLFKLRIYIADYAGLLDTVGDEPPELTPEQIAKLTAIFLRWPNFTEDWLRTPTLLTKVQEDAISSATTVRNIGWSADQDLITLLRLDPTRSAVSSQQPAAIELQPKFSLARVKLESVLRVMPVRVRNILAPAQQAARQALISLEAEYMKTRESLPADPHRTGIMNSIFDRMREAHPKASLTDAEIRRLFSQSDGERIAGLAAVALQSDTRFFDLIYPCIAVQNTAFEQYHALIIARVHHLTLSWHRGALSANLRENSKPVGSVAPGSCRAATRQD